LIGRIFRPAEITNFKEYFSLIIVASKDNESQNNEYPSYVETSKVINIKLSFLLNPLYSGETQRVFNV
jgi:hypothetical protein